MELDGPSRPARRLWDASALSGRHQRALLALRQDRLWCRFRPLAPRTSAFARLLSLMCDVDPADARRLQRCRGCARHVP
eukprot:3705832-Rhodomonas_salina.2